MQLSSYQTLQKIGQQLDKGIYPTVQNGGFIMPNESPVNLTLGEGNIMKNKHQYISHLFHRTSQLLLILVIAHLAQGIILGWEAFQAGNIGPWGVFGFLTVVVTICSWRIYVAMQGLNLSK